MSQEEPSYGVYTLDMEDSVEDTGVEASDRAEESTAVKRAREKCLAQINEERRHFTPEQLQQVRKRMVGWIDRHASERVPLRDTVQLFDANRHRTPRSETVKELQNSLVREMAKERQLRNLAREEGMETLRGRVRAENREETPSSSES